jgi:hypothetical protein
MSATTRSSGPSSVQWLIESRPPSVTWSRQAPREANQPTLDPVEHDEDDAPIAAPNDRGIRVHTVKGALGGAAATRPTQRSGLEHHVGPGNHPGLARETPGSSSHLLKGCPSDR